MWIFISFLAVASTPAADKIPLRNATGAPSLVSAVEPAQTVTLKDIQYGHEVTVRGRPLSDMVKAPKGSLIVLKLENGMVVPVRPEKSSEVFVATQIKSGGGPMVTAFPDVTRHVDFNFDPRPLRYSNTKLVVSNPRAGGIDIPQSATFTPWARTTSLMSIEVVDQATWRTRFWPSKPPRRAVKETRKGQTVFLSRCVYCHGVGDIGASFGTDVLVGVPLAQRYNPEALLSHLTTNKLNDYGGGLMMPPQHNVTRKEVQNLHHYFTSVAQAPPEGASVKARKIR